MTRLTQINGLPVIDAKRPLTITVKRLDISRAKPQDEERCAMARACYRELHCLEVKIYRSRCYIRTNDHNWVRYITPTSLRDETIVFDRGGAMEPGEHTLRPPTGTSVLGSPRRGGKETRQHRGRNHLLTNVRAKAS